MRNVTLLFALLLIVPLSVSAETAALKAVEASAPGAPATITEQATTTQEKSGFIYQYNESDLDFIQREAIATELTPQTEAEVRTLSKTITVKASVRGWDYTSKEQVEASALSAEMVRTEDELEQLVTASVEADPRMEQVSLNFEHMVFHYRSSGSLFGFMPITYTQVVEVNHGANKLARVKVKFPWFRFALSPDVTAKEVEEATKEKHKDWIELDSWSWSVAEQAQLFSTVSNVLKTRHDTVKNSIGNIR